jgi:hypothetical protein
VENTKRARWVSEATLLKASEELERYRELHRLAREAIIATGYFTPEQVGDDLAPRITEMFSAYGMPVFKPLDQGEREELQAALSNIPLQGKRMMVVTMSAGAKYIGPDWLTDELRADAAGGLPVPPQFNDLLLNSEPDDVFEGKAIPLNIPHFDSDAPHIVGEG